MEVSPTLVNLVDGRGFINEEYYLHWGPIEAQSKVMRGYTQCGQYHTSAESLDF